MDSGCRYALLAAALSFLVPFAQAPAAQPERAGDAALEQRVDGLLARLSQRDKVLLMSGGSVFGTAALPEVGIPALRFADGPNGVRSNNDERATVFPTGAAVAAAWNPALAREMGAAIGAAARALGIDVLLGPNVNLQRTPLAGRNFESYSEDPLLSGRIGAAFVAGVQSRGVGASPKHFVGNEQELERLRSSSNIDERTLHEVYLAPFEAIVRESRPWTVMAAYNRVNGVYATEQRELLRDVLKGQWHFDGVVMSDWNAVHSAAPAVNGGTDLEMPGPPRQFGAALYEAARTFQVSQPMIDDAARRMLRLIVRTGALDRPAADPLQRRDSGTAAHRDLARRVAEEAIVLLKNDGALLPLERARVKRIAVIGPNADVPLQQGGGSAAVVPDVLDTPLSALRTLGGDALSIVHAAGVDNDLKPPPADHRLLSADRQRRQPGLAYRYWRGAQLSDIPLYSGVERYFEKTMIAGELQQMAGRWEGWLWPDQDGEHEFRLATRGTGRLFLDGVEIVGPTRGTALVADSDFQDAGKVAKRTLRKGRGYRVRIDYVSEPTSFHQMHFGIRRPEPDLESAVNAARDADVALVFVGVSRTSESEGRDRTGLGLHGRQDELVEKVLAANPRTVVVLGSGAPLALPWLARAPAVLGAWLAGQEGASALARVLFGEVNPSGKLPFTFPKRLEDNPTFLSYSGGPDANYDEGVFVGYRWYDTRKIEPLFAFGHGLSYTRFEYSQLQAPPAANGDFDVTVEVRNAGTRAGSEVVQLYVADEATTDVRRPAKELRAFEKVALEPGQTRTVRFRLTARDLAYYDVHVHDFVATPGAYRLHVGGGLADLRVEAMLRWTAPRDPRLPAPVGASFADGF